MPSSETLLWALQRFLWGQSAGVRQVLTWSDSTPAWHCQSSYVWRWAVRRSPNHCNNLLSIQDSKGGNKNEPVPALTSDSNQRNIQKHQNKHTLNSPCLPYLSFIAIASCFTGTVLLKRYQGGDFMIPNISEPDRAFQIQPFFRWSWLEQIEDVGVVNSCLGWFSLFKWTLVS